MNMRKMRKCDVHASGTIDSRIKEAVHLILQTYPEIKPKRVRVLLNTNIVNHPSIVHSSIDIPDLKIIQGLCNRWRNKNKPTSNKIMDTVNNILDHLYFPTI